MLPLVRCAALLGLLIGARDAPACSKVACDPIAPLTKVADAEAALTSSDGARAARAAVTIASSGTPRQLAALGRALRTRAVLARLKATSRGIVCTLPPILRAIASNPAVEARTAFVGLVKSETWAAREDRSDGSELMTLLLHATATLRPPPPEVVALWKRSSSPDDGWVNVTVMALGENATPAAASLFEALLLDERHDVATRVSWLRSNLLASRDHPEMIRVARRVFESKSAEPVRLAAAEAVFDYRNEWYSTCGGPTRPLLSSYGKEGRAELRGFAAAVLARRPDEPLATAIARTLAELDRLEANEP